MPLITILMAVYEPRIDWLEEQLCTLNNQTYSNLQLLVCDDCSSTVSYEEIVSCVRAHIQAFPFHTFRMEKNVGSNIAFETMTKMAQGDFFAYCDQDDRWFPEKLEKLEKSFRGHPECLLACSDMQIIDSSGIVMANSIVEVRRHHVFRSGANLAQGLLSSNFVTGCTMLVRSTAAKKALPFCPYMMHDHYLALCCAMWGEIQSLATPLIQYRIHGGNQTGLMVGVTDWESYGQVRISLPLQRIQWLQKAGILSGALVEVAQDYETWLRARLRNWNGMGGGRTLWKYRRFGPRSSLAELILVHLPRAFYKLIIRLAKENRV